jgi:hypothetical protein
MNNYLNENERHWLKLMLSGDFEGKEDKEKLAFQIENSEIKDNSTEFFISLRFSPKEFCEPVNITERVPIEMRVFKNNQSPIQFLLHIINGYVDELEVFHADSSGIKRNLEITDDDVVEIISE